MLIPAKMYSVRGKFVCALLGRLAYVTQRQPCVCIKLINLPFHPRLLGPLGKFT